MDAPAPQALAEGLRKHLSAPSQAQKQDENEDDVLTVMMRNIPNKCGKRVEMPEWR